MNLFIASKVFFPYSNKENLCNTFLLASIMVGSIHHRASWGHDLYVF